MTKSFVLSQSFRFHFIYILHSVPAFISSAFLQREQLRAQWPAPVPLVPVPQFPTLAARAARAFFNSRISASWLFSFSSWLSSWAFMVAFSSRPFNQSTFLFHGFDSMAASRPIQDRNAFWNNAAPGGSPRSPHCQAAGPVLVVTPPLEGRVAADRPASGHFHVPAD